LDPFTVVDPNSIEEQSALDVTMHQNVPNPSDKMTSIRVDAKTAGSAHLEVVNMLGEVMFGKNYDLKSGNNVVDIDTSTVPSGIYFYRLKANGKASTLRMIVSH